MGRWFGTLCSSAPRKPAPPRFGPACRRLANRRHRLRDSTCARGLAMHPCPRRTCRIAPHRLYRNAEGVAHPPDMRRDRAGQPGPVDVGPAACLMFDAFSVIFSSIRIFSGCRAHLSSESRVEALAVGDSQSTLNHNPIAGSRGGTATWALGAALFARARAARCGTNCTWCSWSIRQSQWAQPTVRGGSTGT